MKARRKAQVGLDSIRPREPLDWHQRPRRRGLSGEEIMHREILVAVLTRTSAHPRLARALERLVATGLWGATPLEALVRAAEAGVAAAAPGLVESSEGRPVV